MKLKALISSTILSLTLGQGATAALIDNGDITFDTSSGLSWLDLTGRKGPEPFPKQLTVLFSLVQSFGSVRFVPLANTGISLVWCFWINSNSDACTQRSHSR